MKLNPIKAVLISFGESKKMSDKEDSGTKRSVIFKIPERKISDEWGDEKIIREEVYEADIINDKIKMEQLVPLIGQRCEMLCFLNGFEYKKKDAQGKETAEIAYGKSMTLNFIKKAEEKKAEEKK